MGRLVVILIFVSLGLAMAGRSFHNFPWKEKPKRGEYLLTLGVYMLIGGGIGFLAGGWAAGRLPE